MSGSNNGTWRAVWTVVAMLCTATQAAAQAPPPTTDWTFDVGPGVLWTPRFEGSVDHRVLPIPALELRYRRDRFFVSARDGIGATLLDTHGFKAGPVLRYRFGRDESDSGYLRGLGTIPFTIEGGAFARYDFGRHATAKAEIRRGLGGHDGLSIDLSADARLRLDERVFLSAGPRLAIADGTYNQAFYGVNADQSARSGYARYDPGFGLRSVGVGAAAVWRLTDKITATAFGSYGRLVDVAAASPIVAGPGGSRDQYTLGTALSYRFGW